MSTIIRLNRPLTSVCTCDAGTQLHPDCRPASGHLRDHLPQFGKKWFKQQGLTCSFCLRKGHTNHFCPAAPYKPPLEDRCPFVEKVLALPRVKTNAFAGMEREQAFAIMEEKGRAWNMGNPWEHSKKIYDQLRARLGYWRAIGASDSVISWLGYGVPMKFIREPRYRVFKNHAMDEAQVAYMDTDMAKHTESGCFIQAPPRSVKICNPVLIICQGCKNRRCDDCRFGNSLMANPTFRAASLERDVPTITEEGDVAITEDLEKAYYKVPMAKSAQPYASFNWAGVFFFSMVMLFGMCQAPFKFTTICKPISRWFGALRIASMYYIDDWYWPSKPLRVDSLLAYIRKLFVLLGWTFAKKSQKGTRIQLLGFILDLVKRKFIVPHEKNIALSSMLKEFQLAAKAGGAVLVAPLQSAMGKALSMTLAVPGIKVWCRGLYSQITAQKTGSLFLSPSSMEELDMIILLLQLSDGAPFMTPGHSCEIWVDSGEVGWGAHYEGVEVSGQFEARWIGQSSTARELRGLCQALEALGVQLMGKVVRVNMDSMCSVRNILKGGGPVPLLCDLTKQLWQICQRFSIQLSPRWQRRNEPLMQRADVLSKVGTEWALRESYVTTTTMEHSLPVFMPDLAQADKVIRALIIRRQAHTHILPRWEGKSWWQLVMAHATVYDILAREMAQVVEPNMYGWPRWDFVLAVFRFE